MLFRKKKQQPEPIVLVPAPETAQKEKLELKLLEYKAAYERLNWDYLEAIHKILDDKTDPRYIV